MKQEFITDYVMDLPTVRDTNAHFQPWWLRALSRLCTVGLVGMVVYYGIENPIVLKPAMIASLLVIALGTIRNRDGGSAYQKLLKENGGVPPKNIITVHDGGIHIWNPESGNKVDYPFSDIRAIRKSKEHLLLTMADTKQAALNCPRLTGGTPEELEAFLLERCSVRKIQRPTDDRIFQKILLWTCVLGFCWSSLGVYTAFEPNPVSMSAYDAAAVLEDLGITPPEEEALSALQDYGADESMIWAVLDRAGMGEYDFETWEWTPPASGVYAFDMEVFELGHMYTNFLSGVEAISRGELDFQNVTENDDHVDYESGSGYKTVTFTLDGQEHTLRPTMMSDWFDLDFADEVARIAGKSEDGKQLWFFSDGYQMIYVFYADRDWAEAFQDATGYSLHHSIP